MKILHLSAECYPAAKVGGLADVVGALPKYQNRLGHDAMVLMPYYKTEYLTAAKKKRVFKDTLKMDGVNYPVNVHHILDDSLGYDLYAIEIAGLTDLPKVYGYDNDPLRFCGFGQMALHFAATLKKLPDVVHCHDHHTGLVPFMMRYSEVFKSFQNIPSVLSIHNAQYQGDFSHEKGGILPKFDAKHIGMLDWYGRINPLAAAIKCAWAVNTVSPTYMNELQIQANGLEGLLRAESEKCTGILNGIDTETWDPATDSYLPFNYSTRNRISGRSKNKEVLCTEFGLDMSKPLFGFIGRLVWEKGADLLPAVFEEALMKFDINIVFLGSGNPQWEQQMKALFEKYEGQIGGYIGYQERMSHQVYAGADFLLMPSRVEPCGLNQLYSLRYGCVPIVRRTGGLQDTVIDIGDNGFGICHDQATIADVVYSIGRAVQFYQNPKKYKENQRKMMQLDHSWSSAAQNYIDLYNQLKK